MCLHVVLLVCVILVRLLYRTKSHFTLHIYIWLCRKHTQPTGLYSVYESIFFVLGKKEIDVYNIVGCLLFVVVVVVVVVVV